MVSDQDTNEVARIVAVTRRIGGVALVAVGVALILTGGFWFFLVPWFGWATEGFWFAMADWADVGGAVTAALGFLALIVGGALIQRARKRTLEIFAEISATPRDARVDDRSNAGG